MVDLLGKANIPGSAELIKALNKSQVAQAGNTAQANIAKRDMIEAELTNAKATYQEQLAKGILSEEEKKMWEESIAEMERQLQEANLAAMASIEDWMQAINDKFLAETEAAVDRF
jgi:SMC interacting uncharacterized protein involved in chromosome segregation